jgi:hypothetical protein
MIAITRLGHAIAKAKTGQSAVVKNVQRIAREAQRVSGRSLRRTNTCKAVPRNCSKPNREGRAQSRDIGRRGAELSPGIETKMSGIRGLTARPEHSARQPAIENI